MACNFARIAHPVILVERTTSGGDGPALLQRPADARAPTAGSSRDAARARFSRSAGPGSPTPYRRTPAGFSTVGVVGAGSGHADDVDDPGRVGSERRGACGGHGARPARHRYMLEEPGRARHRRVDDIDAP